MAVAEVVDRIRDMSGVAESELARAWPVWRTSRLQSADVPLQEDRVRG